MTKHPSTLKTQGRLLTKAVVLEALYAGLHELSPEERFSLAERFAHVLKTVTSELSYEITGHGWYELVVDSADLYDLANNLSTPTPQHV